MLKKDSSARPIRQASVSRCQGGPARVLRGASSSLKKGSCARPIRQASVSRWQGGPAGVFRGAGSSLGMLKKDSSARPIRQASVSRCSEDFEGGKQQSWNAKKRALPSPYAKPRGKQQSWNAKKG